MENLCTRRSTLPASRILCQQASTLTHGLKTAGMNNLIAPITDDSYRPRLVLASNVWKKYLRAGSPDCNIPNLVDPPLALDALDDDETQDSPAIDFPLPVETGPVDQNGVVVATATYAKHAWRTGMPLEPGSIASNSWPSSTPTRGRTAETTPGACPEASELETGDQGRGVQRPRKHSPDSKGGTRYGPYSNGAAVFTSNSNGVHSMFILTFMRSACLVVSVQCIAIMVLL
jgi:hypothetical protein